MFHWYAAVRQAIEIYRMVLGLPARFVQFGTVLLLPYLAIPFVREAFRVAGWTGAVGTAAVVELVLDLWIAAILAIRWHRLVLLGKAGPGATDVRFGRRELVYLITDLVLTLPLLIVAGVLASLVEVQVVAGGSWDLVLLQRLALGVVMVVALAFLFARLGHVLPAVALGHRPRFGAAWRLSANGWEPLFALLFVTTALTALASGALEPLAGAALPFFAIVGGIALNAVSLVATAVLAVALSLNYRALAGDDEVATGAG